MKILTDTLSQGVIVLDDKNSFLTATTLANFSQVVSSSFNIFDTGLMPKDGTGLLSYRHVGAFCQIVYQVEAGFHLVKWGEYESDDDVETVNLAHPYKIWIADFHNNRLVGLRHFASPEPIYSLEDPLYHLPLPNTNCTGYQQTSVGWVCLYQTGTQDLVTLQDKIQYAFERESGLHEPYNNNNMSETDGPRFYENRGIYFFSSPGNWITKSIKEESGSWATKEENLIAITVGETPREHLDVGTVYTLGKAINDPYYPYYPRSLSADQTKFYDNGWAKNLQGVYEFTPQTMSKLGSVEPPKDLDIQELMNSLNVEEDKILDFELWNSEKKLYLSKLILNLKTNCCLCGGNEFSDNLEENKVVPTFYSALIIFPPDHPTPIERTRSYVKSTDGPADFVNMNHYEYDLWQTLMDIEPSDEDGDDLNFCPSEAPDRNYYLCNSCIPDNSIRLPFSEEVTYLVFNRDGSELFLDSNECYAHMLSLYDDAVTSGYMDWQDFSLWASVFFGDENGSTGYNIVPQTALITCMCDSVYELKFNSITGIGVPKAFPFMENFHYSTNLYAKHVRACPSCAPLLSDFISNEMMIGASSSKKLLTEFSNFVLADHSNHFFVRNTIRASFAENSIWSTDKWLDYVDVPHRIDLLQRYYYAMLYVNGTPTFVVDVQGEFEKVVELPGGQFVYQESEIIAEFETAPVSNILSTIIPIVYPDNTNPNNNSTFSESEVNS